MKKRVYIAGPISKGLIADNINQATGAFHALLRLGFAPLCPHWSCFAGGVQMTQSGTPYAFAEKLPMATTHEDWLGVDLPWVAVADAVLRLPGESVGADQEVAEAEQRGIPVFTNVTELKAWARSQPPEVQLQGWAASPPPIHDDAKEDEGGGGLVKGIGPDAPIVTNECGGKQSATPFRCDLLPPLATLAVAEVLAHGAAKYGANNWHAIPVEDHLNHALAHIFADRAGDAQDDHLEHAACRIMMALDQKRAGRRQPG